MKKFISFAKDCVKTAASTIYLIVSVYLGAISFLMALFIDTALKLSGSEMTVDKMIQNFEESSAHYRTSFNNFHFKDLKLPF